jgi:hypothetical protein
MSWACLVLGDANDCRCLRISSRWILSVCVCGGNERTPKDRLEKGC